MRKASNESAPDHQGGFAFAPLDLGDISPARCPKGLHDMPPGCVACPQCLKVEGEKQKYAQHDRAVLQAADAIKRGSDDVAVFCVGVAGYLHLIPAVGFKKAFCGELVNPKYVTRKDRKSVWAMSGAYCSVCLEFIGH